MTIKDFVAYVKQTWANRPSTNSPLSAERLNHIENGIKENSDGIEALAAAVVSQIMNDPDKIASAAALFAVNEVVKQQSSDLAAVETDLSNVHVQIDPLKANYVNDINRNIVNKVNIVLWDSKTTDTPFKTGNTIRGNGFCITYSSGEPFLCQLAMAVGDSNLFTRHKNEGGWSGWTTK